MTRGEAITLFLCGDVMPGRGIDQILPHPGDPTLHEPYVRDARDYVELAERVNGPLGRQVAPFQIPDKGRVLVFAYGSPTSGVPDDWVAAPARPGINLLPDFFDAAVKQIKKTLAKARQPGDIIIVSLHWGGNWGYDIPAGQRRFAHGLIDQAGVDLVYGHSSHHVKGIEVYRQKLILYGCGDFLNDYEGISGYEEFRADLTLIYFPRLCVSTGQLEELRMVPMRIKRFRTVYPEEADARWLSEVLYREGARLNTRVRLNGDNSLSLLWDRDL